VVSNKNTATYLLLAQAFKPAKESLLGRLLPADLTYNPHGKLGADGSVILPR